MKNVDYKNLSLKEFDKAAAKFDDNDPSVYNQRISCGRFHGKFPGGKG